MYRLDWQTPNNFRMEDDKIFAVEKSPIKTYNPFDFYNKPKQKSLYLQFVEVDESNQASIFEFISKFGFLTHNYLNYPSGTLEERVGMLERYGEPPRWESISEIARKIREMRNILLLIQTKLAPDAKRLAEEILEQILKDDLRFSMVTELNVCTDESFVKLVGFHTIRKYTSGIYDYTWVDSIGKTGPALFAPNLLAIMYKMIDMDVKSGHVIGVCKNPSCNKINVFNANYKNKIFCSESCARTAAQREYRKRKRLNKEGQS
jgi:hypothetical protein